MEVPASSPLTRPLAWVTLLAHPWEPTDPSTRRSSYNQSPSCWPHRATEQGPAVSGVPARGRLELREKPSGRRGAHSPSWLPGASRQVSRRAAPPSPVLVSRQQQPLKVQVELLAFGGSEGPHALHALGAVLWVGGCQDAAKGGVLHCPPAGCWKARAGEGSRVRCWAASLRPSDPWTSAFAYRSRRAQGGSSGAWRH